MNIKPDAALQAQYDAYPYPERNPADEARRFLIGSPSHLREVDYWVFGARRPAAAPLRALVAGCGTGDGAIMLAQHLARDQRPGEVVALDRSARALDIARARAEVRGLDNIRFIEGSLLELERLELGLFDYIDCCGVLHHLPDPAQALCGLAGLLSAGGGMGLMVYAPYGRTGVYMLQEALKTLAGLEEAPEARLDVARRVMRQLPSTAWLRFNRNFGDHLTGGDAGLYDLLLNPQDRAYTVDALYDLVEGAGLTVRSFMEPLRYDPALFLPDPKLRERVAGLTVRRRQALAEALVGNMATHVVYVTRRAESLPSQDPVAASSIPVLREPNAQELARCITPDGRMAFAFGTLECMVPVPRQSKILLGLIDGRRSVGDIAAAMAQKGLPPERFAPLWKEFFTIFSGLNRVLLRASDQG